VKPHLKCFIQRFEKRSEFGRHHGHGRRHDDALTTRDCGAQAQPNGLGFGHSQRATGSAASAPASCAAMKAGAPVGAIPANVSDRVRARVTAGLANDVDAVNQYADVM
jgi:hypothetical protein